MSEHLEEHLRHQQRRADLLDGRIERLAWSWIDADGAHVDCGDALLDLLDGVDDALQKPPAKVVQKQKQKSLRQRAQAQSVMPLRPFSEWIESQQNSEVTDE